MTWELWLGLYVIVATSVTVWSVKQRCGPYGWDRLELDDVLQGLIAPFFLVIAGVALVMAMGAIIVSFLTLALFQGQRSREGSKGGKKRKGRK